MNNERNISSRIYFIVFLLLLVSSVPACSKPSGEEKKAKALSAEEKAKILDNVKKAYICPETSASIAESYAEELLCPTGDKALELVGLMADAGWEEEKINASVKIFVQGRDNSFTVPAGSPSLGDPKAPLTLVEFTDMQCPYCKRYFDTAFSALKSDYVDTGKLLYVQLNLPLSFHKQAQKAAESLYCAEDENKFWELRAALFANQQDLSVEAIQKYASGLGIGAGFKECVDSGRHAGRVQGDMALASRAGINGTPGFVVAVTRADGKIRGALISGAQPVQNFKAVIDQMLAKAGAK